MKVDSKDTPLFLIRLWDRGDKQNAQSPWHGKVLHVVTGEAHYFTGWSELASVMQEMAAPRAGGQSKQPIDTLPASDDNSMLIPDEEPLQR